MTIIGIVRPALVWHRGAGSDGLQRAIDWGAALHGCEPRHLPAGAVCIWSPQPIDDTEPEMADGLPEGICWHSFDLPAALDHHAHRLAPGERWSPWGTKAGPNHQFFSLMAQSPAIHTEPWLLLVEPDTHPMGPNVARTVRRLVSRHDASWMIGAEPHPLSRAKLPLELHRHLNGAALYHVGDPAFVDFVRYTWLPSLLVLAREDPILAWDCLTDPGTFRRLPPPLVDEWERSRRRFTTTAGMLNLSVAHLDDAGVVKALGEPEVLAGLKREEVRPWQLHAKGSFSKLSDMTGPVRTHEETWAAFVEPLARASVGAGTTTLILHQAKTGGSSLKKNLRETERCATARLPVSTLPEDQCTCGRPDCQVRPRPDRDIPTMTGDACGRPLFIICPHERYEPLRWLVDAVADAGGRIDEILHLARPIRTRMRSMFTDYWTSLERSRLSDLQPTEDTSHFRAIMAGYVDDSRNYRRPDGSIDGPRWFEAFDRFGPGIPFYLADLFDGDPSWLDHEIASGLVRVVPTSGLDSYLQNLIGTTPQRRRVSRTEGMEAVYAAIEDASTLVDDLARTDDKFDAVIGRHLSDPAFSRD